MSTHPRQPAFKRFLGTALLTFILIFGVVWGWVLEEQMAFQDFDYSIWLAKLTLVREGKVGSLTILGDSDPCAALLPERLGPGVINLGLPTGTPIEVFYVARKIVAAPIPPKAILVSFSPSDFVSSEHFWDVVVNYGFLTFNDVEEIRSRSRALNDASVIGPDSPGDLDVRLKSFLYLIKFPSFYFPALVHSHGNGRYEFNEERLQLVLVNRGHSYYGTDKGSTLPDRETNLPSFVPAKILDDYFNQTLALFQSRNIAVYFLATPHNEASVQQYAPALKDSFARYLKRYGARYQNFHVLGDPMPVYPSVDFGDPWHLNEKGAAEWSDYVAKLLNDSNVAGGPYGPN